MVYKLYSMGPPKAPSFYTIYPEVIFGFLRCISLKFFSPQQRDIGKGSKWGKLKIPGLE